MKEDILDKYLNNTTKTQYNAAAAVKVVTVTVWNLLGIEK